MNLISNGELIRELFNSKLFREKLTEFVVTLSNSRNQSALIWVCAVKILARTHYITLHSLA